MKLKFFILTFLYVIVSVFLTLFQSCENLLTYKASICDIEFRGLTSTYPDIQPDTMLSDVGFVITSKSDKMCYVQPTFNLISSCYATTKCAKWQNEIVQSSFRLSFDRQVIIDGNTISPNTDLFQVEKFINGVEVNKNGYECKYIGYSITLSSSLLNTMEFEQGIYNVSFICSTNDNKTFSKQRQVVLKL